MHMSRTIVESKKAWDHSGEAIDGMNNDGRTKCNPHGTFVRISLEYFHELGNSLSHQCSILASVQEGSGIWVGWGRVLEYVGSSVVCLPS